ncbi:MAG TPA: 16S rRNA (guanine(527)-N(7))-methyltransferase RsmG [Hyphomicrobiaceae bacterium]|nr:16S rRNA (guanine(527)-N(7))-methyltransferase RsmG [Hyphomicrobiaceae bacterium]
MSDRAGPLLPLISGPEDFARAFDVSRETIDKLGIYVSLLSQWQKRINLVANATLPEVWHRHVADSAQLVALAPPKPRLWLDLGSGGGFPGLVVAIMLHGAGTRVILVESDRRKAAFLAEVARQTGTSVEIQTVRIEQMATQGMLAPVEVVSARALAPLVRLISLSLPFFGDDTVGIFPKGRGAESEVADARAAWAFDVETIPSLTDEAARIVLVRRPRAITEG